MKAVETRAVIDHYFALMGQVRTSRLLRRGCALDDVRWRDDDLGSDNGSGLSDRVAPEHARHPNPAALVCGRERLCRGRLRRSLPPSTDRIAFCMAYDIANGVITSARCYGR